MTSPLNHQKSVLGYYLNKCNIIRLFTQFYKGYNLQLIIRYNQGLLVGSTSVVEMSVVATLVSTLLLVT